MNMSKVVFILLEEDLNKSVEYHDSLMDDLLELINKGCISTTYVEFSSSFKGRQKPVYQDCIRYEIYYDENRKGDTPLLNSIIDRVKETKEETGQNMIFFDSDVKGTFII